VFFAGMSSLVLGGRLMGGSCKARISAPTSATARGQESVVGLREIVESFAGLGVVHNGANRHGDVNGFTVATLPVAALAVTATLALVFRVEAQMEQRVVVLTGN
jgi:hypothetical protein